MTNYSAANTDGEPSLSEVVGAGPDSSNQWLHKAGMHTKLKNINQVKQRQRTDFIPPVTCHLTDHVVLYNSHSCFRQILTAPDRLISPDASKTDKNINSLSMYTISYLSEKRLDGLHLTLLA